MDALEFQRKLDAERMKSDADLACSLADPPFAVPPRTIALNLPPPPSVNKTRRNHGKGQARLKKWHQSADMLVLSQGRLPKPIPGQFEATIILAETCRLDLDNGVKHVIDYARRLNLITDDNKNYLRRLTVEWGDAPEGCRLTLRECA